MADLLKDLTKVANKSWKMGCVDAQACSLLLRGGGTTPAVSLFYIIFFSDFWITRCGGEGSERWC
jgi:hypothetical protein